MAGLLQKFDEQLYKIGPVATVLQKIESKTGVKREISGKIIAAIVLIQLIMGIGLRLVGGVISWIWPMYKCLQALEAGDNDEIRRWLKYWIVFSLLSCLENVAGFLLAMIPFYSLIRTAVIGLMMVHDYASAAVYELIVKPIWKSQDHLESLRRDSDIAMIRNILDVKNGVVGKAK